MAHLVHHNRVPKVQVRERWGQSPCFMRSGVPRSSFLRSFFFVNQLGNAALDGGHLVVNIRHHPYPCAGFGINAAQNMRRRRESDTPQGGDSVKLCRQLAHQGYMLSSAATRLALRPPCTESAPMGFAKSCPWCQPARRPLRRRPADWGSSGRCERAVGLVVSSFSMLGKAKEFEELIPEMFMVASFMLMTRRGSNFPHSGMVAIKHAKKE